MPVRFLLSFFLLVMSGGISCKKETPNEQLGIPYYKVDQYILLSSPSSIAINSVGGWMYLSGGSRGIILYHRAYEEYVAFDRHCTYQPEQSCGQVSVDTATTVILNCACCASRFSIIDGSVLSGPAIRPLLQYNARLSDPGTLHVYN